MRKSAFLLIAAVVLMLCTITQAWTTPQQIVTGINTSGHEICAFPTYDGKSFYFTRGYGIYQATRQGTSGPFTSVQQVLSGVYGPWVSPDNLRMYYWTEGGTSQIRETTRATVNDSWTYGTTLSELNVIGSVQDPRLSQDERTIVFASKNGSGGMGDYDIYIATRFNTSSPFGNIRNLSEINTSALDAGQFLAPDGLTLYFNSTRNGPAQLFKATRQSLSDSFGNLEHLSFFDSSYGSLSPALSADGSTLFLTETMANGYGDIYSSEVPEPVTLLLLGLGGLMLRKKS